MKKRPSNSVLAVLLSILALFGIYVAGNLVLETRQDVTEEEEISEDRRQETEGRRDK